MISNIEPFQTPYVPEVLSPGLPTPWILAPSYVLVVDDDDDVRGVVRETLDEAGYACIEAEDGVKALAALRAQPGIGLIYLDLMLPRVTGWEVMREVAGDDDLRRIPVVVMTALAPPAHAREWLGKPFDRDGVLRFADRHLGPGRLL